MSRPRLTRSIPFWALIAGSAASIAGGAVLLVDKLGTMATTLLDGTATGVDVYAGQIWAVFGAVLVGAGLVGLALALTLAALRSFVPVASEETVVVVEETLIDDEPVVDPEPEVVEPAAEPAATR